MNKTSLRILALDDDQFALNLLSRTLSGMGFESITTRDNGPAALQVVASDEPPELILLDLNMPNMDGVEFVRRLVDHNYVGSLVLISGEDERVLHMAESLIRAHRIAILGHLTKPFSFPDLKAIMEKALQVGDDKPVARKSYEPGAVRDAIHTGQLINFYQPKVRVTSSEVVGVEALVRWEHPEDGLVFPDQFIGLAEENGLIDDLTRVVLRNALEQSYQWRMSGLPLIMAVNVSMDNLSSVDFAEFVAAEAAECGVMPQDIMLEVTESRLMLDKRAPLEVLTRLRMKRFGLAIDDFGTGHSSMSQLRDIPFDELKIDRTFVHDAWRDPTARAIYDASLTLGKQLGMVVVAEGVEDKQDWELLERTRCELAQGYFISRPMRAENLLRWVEEWNQQRRRQGAAG